MRKCACVCACVHACVRTCVCVRARACACVRTCVFKKQRCKKPDTSDWNIESEKKVTNESGKHGVLKD